MFGALVSALDPQLQLLGGFRLTVLGEVQPVQRSTQRLMAFLALQDRPVARSYVAGLLWLDQDELRANASLRSALWRLNRVSKCLIAVGRCTLEIGPKVQLDTREFILEARSLTECGSDQYSGFVDETSFCVDLLPDWDEDWVLLERERFRYLKLASLEHISQCLIDSGDQVEAVRVAALAVRCDELRESAQRALIRAHIALGNYAEAVRQYRRYSSRLYEALQIAPSPLMESLMQSITSP